MEVNIIRHGKTDSNVKGVRQGSKTDLPLNEEGRKEILRIRLQIEDSYNSVYSSPLKRALQTARLLFPGMQIVINELLSEYDFGELEGIPFSTPYTDFPDNKIVEYNGREFLIPNKGETFEDIYNRCKLFINYLRDNNSEGNKIAVVTHGTNFEILKAIGEEKIWHAYLGKARELDGFTQFKL